ncbi:MAG: aldolase/citrate lyase family protein [Azospirillaceae bacterium]
MIKSNPVKQLLADGKPAFGTWITLSPHPRVVKILAAAGFDFVIIEMEHTDFTLSEVGVLAMLARECGLVPIVRPPGTIKPHDLTRPLDAGAQGLLLPAVESAEQMRAIVEATKYHPLGNRPMNLKGPHTDYHAGQPKEMIAHLNAHTLSVVMIESRRAIDALDDILAVEGVDAIMIGPDDLSQDLGVPGEMQSPVLLEAYEEIFAACRKAGVPYGLSCHSPDLARKWVDKGATWLPYSNDAAMVLNAARAVVPELMAIGGRT